MEYQLSPAIKFVSGRSCQVVQVCRQEKTKRRIIRELWIEKEVGYRIRQCTIPDQLITAAEKHLADAENALSGRYLIQKKRHKIDKAIVLANRLGKPLPPPTDPSLLGIVAVSILFWIVGGYLFWKWSK